jgi:prepilin-type N-terminal cleavage/methylation domain-containing protein
MKSESGFTLLECLIALTILGLGAALAMQDSWSGVWGAKQGWREAQALRLAQSVSVEAGIAFAVPPEGIESAEPGLPFRVKVRPETQGDGRLLYRVEVFAEQDGQLLASLIRRPKETWQ